QERFTWISPPSFTPRILEIYNKEFELPNVAEGARASAIGKVTKKKDYVIKAEGKIICNVPIDVVTEGIRYEREKVAGKKELVEPDLPEPEDYSKEIIDILKHPNVASKALVFKHYDTEVQGLAVIRPGQADAGVQAPIPGSSIGYALSVDCNPRYSRISSFWGAANAVAESMRNVAAVGSVPSGMTDCLNYGNPEVPTAFNDFYEGVKGEKEAAENLFVKGTKDPCPFVSGNVSFYNESAAGKSVDPSAIIACVGVLPDYSKAITMKIKKPGSKLFMIGERKDELGGSVYYENHGELGKNVPKVEYEKERARIYAVIDAINERLLLSCHDISDGGMAAAVSEMILGGEADGKIGAEISLGFSELRNDKIMFSESSGFVFEVNANDVDKVKKIMDKYKVEMIELGTTTKQDKLVIDNVTIHVEDLRRAWTTGFVEAMK
ncbi:MAG: phosphoribosylformylglycinamidine synthase, partial [Nanoarchaeota archaeon]|nr:phosphoribosylformylglycinamidine synthase [Nanoarchaeota archaeon]